MMKSSAQRIVLTGGPCAGKTTLTEVIARVFHEQVAVIPEAASLLFSGGFPRWNELDSQKAVQRAIYRVQCELEAAFSAKYPERILILDRGTVDGAAYWPEGPERFFSTFNTTLTQELARYDHVLYLESAAQEDYLFHIKKNPNRTENWNEAKRLDEETRKLWSEHFRMKFVANQRSFDLKVSEVISLIREILDGKKV